MDPTQGKEGSPSHIPTRVLILSDTHGRANLYDVPPPNHTTFGLAIHCGDLTQESKMNEFRTTLDLLREVKAKVKVVIAGNHDITLHEDLCIRHLASAGVGSDDPVAVREYGRLGEAKELLLSAKEEGIVFLEEGIHTLDLPNGASVTLYANPWTPRKASEGTLGTQEAGWAFQYEASDAHHHFSISPNQSPDIILTHGPPHGVLDRIPGQRAGCPSLFTLASRMRPQLHCFGHIHAGWGAHLVTWRGNKPTCDQPTHFTEIDNERSSVLERLSGIKEANFDDEEVKRGKRERLAKMREQGYCQLQLERPIQRGQQTLFVNASIEGDEDMPTQSPFSVTLELPKTKSL